MRYNKIRKLDVSNGPGIRTTIFVSGCTHDCEGCFNKELQDFDSGEVWTKEKEDLIVDYLKKPVVVGINILGGEPLQQTMDDDLKNLLKRCKQECPDKTIWLWTGDLFEEAIKNEKKLEILKYVDVLIDGPFVLKKKDLNLYYRGSSNQRVIDVFDSLKTGEVVEIDV